MRKILIFSIFALAILLTACAAEISTSETLEATVTTGRFNTYINNLKNKYNIALFVTEDMTTSIGINFELPKDQNGYVEYCEYGDNQYVRAKASKKIRQLSEDTVYLYEYVIGDLTPGTTYEYRITNEDYSEVSAYYRFKTISEDQDSYSFMFLADPQENAETGYMTYAYSVTSVLDFAQKDIQLVMFPGDLVNNHNIRSQWNMFFRYSSVFSFNLPIASAIGNHEAPDINGSYLNSVEFDGYMNLPNNGPVYGTFDELAGDARISTFDKGKTYSFDYGFAHIVVIDSEIYCDGTLSCLNYDVSNATLLNNWIRNDLNNSDKEWKIVLLHRGPYGASYDTENVRSSLVPILEECEVDLVLTGHEHQYSRAVYWQNRMVPFSISNDYLYGTISLSNSLPVNSNFNNYSSTLGITYLTSNTSGTKFYGDNMSSGIQLNYIFEGEFPVIPIITIYENKIEVVSYAVSKESGLTIVPEIVFILDEFQIV